MLNSRFRQSLDSDQLLLISRHCMKQLERLKKQHERLAAQREWQWKLEIKLLSHLIKRPKRCEDMLCCSAPLSSVVSPDYFKRLSEEPSPIALFCQKYTQNRNAVPGINYCELLDHRS